MRYVLGKDELSIILEGGEQVAALRAKIKVSKADILSVDWLEFFNDWPRFHVRMPGSHIPRYLMAGSYWSDEGWSFVYAKNPRTIIKPTVQNVLVIKTKQDKFARIVVQLPKEAEKEINKWLKKN